MDHELRFRWVRTAVAFGVAMALVASACGSDDDQAEVGPASATEAPSAATEPATSTTAGQGSAEPAAADDDGSDALAFFQGTEAVCAEHADEHHNPIVEPERFSGATVGERVGDGLWRIVDGEGEPLIVDLGQGIITGLEGPDGLIPNPYSFGCPEDLYIGTLAS